ncbi:type II secretion system F family protein [Trinickia dinghuensis]|uniref:Pilus assembly protein n=1 Tax=Trinickia dinghuensis TaxID=2291023 RepID=A0A3D8JXI8_9BURK|nr:type II secretion system F family protein [Trinickia dinghuensis]RDU97364.1 pilus assembly protein [Trinickia dinghuensis]
MLLAALALVCVALALLLWQRGVRAQRRVSTQRFVERRVAAPGSAGGPKDGAAAHATGARPTSAPASGATPARAAGASASPGSAERAGPERHWHLPQAIEHIVVRAGLSGAGTPLTIALAALTLGVAWLGLRVGLVAAGAALVVSAVAVSLFVTARSQHRRLAIVRQLPTFLDGIVRLVTLGNSVPAAFQAALQTTEAPLRECLDHVSRMMRAGVEIDRALAHVAIVYRTREFDFVGAVLRLSVKYGGRADVMLERMSTFMRDVEQAERELSAMSAETRLSAWVLVALPLLIGGYLVATNPSYFTTMWSDIVGRRLIFVSFALQAAGGYLLYRLTRLRT